MPTKINRAQVALSAGDTLKNLGERLLRFRTQSDSHSTLLNIEVGLGGARAQLRKLADSLRVARNSYATYPRVRAVYELRSDEVTELEQSLQTIHEAVLQTLEDPSVTCESWGMELISIGQKLRIMKFYAVTPEKEAV